MVAEQGAIQIASVVGEGSHYDYRNHFLSLNELLSATLPLDPATAQSYHASGAWGDRTFYDIVAAHAAARADAPAITSSFRTYSWRDLVTGRRRGLIEYK